MTQTILTSYIPVYLYSYTLLLFLPVMYFLLVRLVPSQRSVTTTCSPLFHRLVRVLPGIVWPDFWASTGASGVQTGGGSSGAAGLMQQQEQGQGQGQEDQSRLRSSRQLLKPDDIAASFMHHTAVLLTFGLTNPVLAVAVTSTICLQTVQWVMLLNRFVFKRLLLSGMWGEAVVPREGGETEGAGGAAAIASATAATAPASSQQRDELVGGVIACIERERRGGGSGVVGDRSTRSTQHCKERDQCLSLVETSVQNFEAMLSLCVVPVVAISCVFFVFFSWDIAADRLGFVQSIWVPLIAVAIPFVLVLHVTRTVCKHGR